MERSETVSVLFEDVWTALGALDHVEGAQDQDSYQRLEKAVNLAT